MEELGQDLEYVASNQKWLTKSIKGNKLNI